MKTRKGFTMFKVLMIPAFIGAFLAPLFVSNSTSATPIPDPRTIVVTLLGGQQQKDKMEVTISIDGTKIEATAQPEVLNDVPLADRPARSVSLGSGKLRQLNMINNSHRAEVVCATNEAECGSVNLADGGKIAACICKQTVPAKGSSRMPVAVLAKLVGPIQGGGTTCWDGKDLNLSICYSAGSTPPTAPMPRTREHILLAKTNY